MTAYDSIPWIPLGARAVVALGLAVALALVHTRHPRGYLRPFARSFVALAAFHAATAAALAMVAGHAPAHPMRLVLAAVVATAGYAQAAWLGAGAFEIAKFRPVRERDWKLIVLVVVGLGTTTPLFLLALPDEVRFQIGLLTPFRLLVVAGVLVTFSELIRRTRQKLDGGVAFGILIGAFVMQGAALLAEFVVELNHVADNQLFQGEATWATVDTFLMLFTGMAIMLAALEDEREAAVTAASQVEHIAYHDPLTGLPNRSLFFDRVLVALSHASRHQYKLAVLFLDLDRFKQINDSLGHTMGDTLLRSAAERIRKCVREEDTVARFGGDEFAVLIHIIGRIEHAGKIARKMLDALSLPFTLGEREIFITGSVGVAIYPNDGTDAENLVKNADTAMYRAKHQGGDSYQFYTSSMNSRALEMLELESGLRRALKNDEFVLFYQPLIDLHTSSVYGLEALLRWKHPDFGVLLPERFIQTAEISGLIIPIGNWVLREACRQAKNWQRQRGTDLVVSVNLSARQFHQEDLIDQVRFALEEAHLQPRMLELEITETNAMQDVTRTIRILRELKTLGVRIAIDDFGTGYSSLSYLKEFPVDTLKLDQSFVRDLIAPQDAKIVSGVIAMAHSMSLQVMAEGVETLSQLDFLRAHSCDKLQGYLFSRPLPADAFDRYISHHKTVRGLA